MSKVLKKYLDVDVVAFLEEKMKANTEHYQTDFEYDRQMFERFVKSDRKEDKVLLWLSRRHGTQCMREYEAFLRGTEAYTTWQYYAGQESEGCVAFAVELKGVQDGVIRGNVFELDYEKHAELVKKEAQPAYEVVKTFEDGHVAQAAFARSSYGYWAGMVEEHGAIVESRAVPSDGALLRLTLAEQKRMRDKMKVAEIRPLISQQKEVGQEQKQGTLDDVLEDAVKRSEAAHYEGQGDRGKVQGKV